jgi:hypothetical protein
MSKSDKDGFYKFYKLCRGNSFTLDATRGVEENFCEAYKSYVEQKFSEHNKAKRRCRKI